MSDQPAPPDDRDDAADLLPVLDGRVGPAIRLAHARQQAMARSIVERALDAPAVVPAATVAPAATVEPATVEPAAVEATTARRPRAGRLLLAAAMVAAMVGTAAAVVATRLLQPSAPASGPPAPIPPAPVPAPPAPIAPAPPAPIVELATPAPTLDPPTETPRTAPPLRPAARPEPRPAPVAADLLALASDRRRARAWREADALYRRVARDFAGQSEASVAEVASATLHLEHLGDAAGARAGYRRALALRPAGVLAEEARWGLIECARVLGEPDAERAALRDFLARHPGSALAAAAERRLRALAP